ncbi:unnamed protein product [Staurois parvus]|uniref:Secreted protein n=1 Tax=Staurois parvus TaxID=386267 RepID=A0ABN9HSM5_9NEOB|nr:unnamed protein product [Staurois parvus]
MFLAASSVLIALLTILCCNPLPDLQLLNPARDLSMLRCYRPGLSDHATHIFPSSSHQLYAIGGCRYRSWGYSGAATWSQAASSPSPPSGALVKGSLGLRLRALRDSGLWVVAVVSRCVTLP